MATPTTTERKYFVPAPAPWPVMFNCSLVIAMVGLGVWFNGLGQVGQYIFYIGVALALCVFFFWFRAVINESMSGAYGKWEEKTFRIAMLWFIFSEVMFFGAFFGALFYTHALSVPWLAGAGEEFYTHFYLWPNFAGGWPSNGPANVGGAFSWVEPWRLPLLNTVLLLCSSVTVTWAHWGLKKNNRIQLCAGLAVTVALGIAFLYSQGVEYTEAYQHLGLTLGSGVYGSTFFMLTGFHGLHVTIGTIMLIVILLRALKGHFRPDDCFGFEGVSWYWHFVDVVWLNLFVFVYII